MNDNVTEDALLGGRVKLCQPKSGYRAAIDPVILAAAVDAKANETVLDVGIGVGAAALCLATRLVGVRIVGIEIQEELAALAVQNAENSGFAERFDVNHVDLATSPKKLQAGTFEHVMTNPPYAEQDRGRGSPKLGKRVANQETSVPLGDWIEFCLRMLRPKGTFTMIHRADRLDEVLAALAGQAGETVVYPLWPGPDKKPAKRIVIKCRKGVRTPLVLAPGLVLHQADGSFTLAAEKILKTGEGLDLSSAG